MNERGGKKAQTGICEDAGNRTVDVCCIDVCDLLQSVARKDDLDEGEDLVEACC